MAWYLEYDYRPFAGASNQPRPDCLPLPTDLGPNDRDAARAAALERYKDERSKQSFFENGTSNHQLVWREPLTVK